LRYNNYHKHTTKSSIFTPDTHIQMEEYFKRAVELGHTTYFTTEHGFGGDIFEAVKLSQKEEYKDIKVIFALEGYIVPVPLEKDDSNYHIILIARTDDARKKLNKINSRANKEGYYYKPRIFIEDLLKLDKDDIYITTACVAGIIRDDIGIKEIFMPLVEHFGQSVMIEVQSHNEEIQKQANLKGLELAQKYNLKLIHSNDSHYIYPEQAKDRLEYLKGKGITYGDEDSFILDYPEYDEILKRYKLQGILKGIQVQEAIQNTLILDDCEGIKINKNIKMPSIYPNLTPNERFEKLRHIIFDKWKIEKENIPKNRHQKYIDAIKFELDIIKDTNEEVHTADYFLLNERIVDIAVNEYNGKLTKSGRGSGVSFLINKLLGFTGIDRLALNVPIYPTRFISKSRLLETKNLPDFDFNTASAEPFVQATKDLLGENGCYWMIAYGTMKDSEAFRNVCRNMDLEYSEYNEVAKNIDSYRDDKYWGKIIEYSEKFVDSIVSVSPHPCANILLDEDIEEEIGIIKIKDKLCALITSTEADEWKYLKNDYLEVTVVEIINDVFELLDKEVIEVNELLNSLNDKVWKLYENGITTTLNQVDSDFATNLVKKYAPTSYEELSSFVAAIRPGFASLLDTFINREYYTNGVKALDDLLKDTNNMMLYQESVMGYLVWLGIPEDITYNIIKKIAKKILTEEELEDLHSQLIIKWVEKVGTEKGFKESWQVVENNSRYSFNASHSASMMVDSLYGAYLKANHPLEYYKVVLDKYIGDMDRTTRLVNELSYFSITLNPAKFRYSSGNYTMDKKSNSIYKGISSIKNISSQLGEELFILKDNQYNSFIHLLYDIKNKTSCNTRELDILIQLDFFSEFGKSQKLLSFVPYFNAIYEAKVINKDKFKELNHIISKYSRETEKQYRDIDNYKILEEIWNLIPNKEISIAEKLKAQTDYLGYIDYANPKIDKKYILVTKLDTRYSPKFIGYCLNNGKTQELKVYKQKKGRGIPGVKSYFKHNPFEDGDLLYTKKFRDSLKSRKTDSGFEKIPNTQEWWLIDYKVVNDDVIDCIIND